MLEALDAVSPSASSAATCRGTPRAARGFRCSGFDPPPVLLPPPDVPAPARDAVTPLIFGTELLAVVAPAALLLELGIFFFSGLDLGGICWHVCVRKGEAK